ncbi:MAG: hypothetical protein KDL87_17340 [Verrucomicrobiae bacterium]|nr:hypothetical protein [Verrucomicrobiae bacterium]
MLHAALDEPFLDAIKGESSDVMDNEFFHGVVAVFLVGLVAAPHSPGHVLVWVAVTSSLFSVQDKAPEDVRTETGRAAVDIPDWPGEGDWR